MASADDVFDLVREGLVVIDLEGRISRWNKASERIYGWTRAEVLGRSYDELLGGRRLPADEALWPWREPGRSMGLVRKTATVEW